MTLPRVLLLFCACAALAAADAGADAEAVPVSVRVQALEQEGDGSTLRLLVLDVDEGAALAPGALLDVPLADDETEAWRGRIGGLHRVALQPPAEPAARWHIAAYHGAIEIGDVDDLPKVATPSPRDFASRAHRLALEEEGLSPADAPPDEPPADAAALDRLLERVLDDELAWERFLDELETGSEPVRRPAADERPSASPAPVAERPAIDCRVLDVAGRVLVRCDGVLAVGPARVRDGDGWSAVRVLACDGRFALLDGLDPAPSPGAALRLRPGGGDHGR